MSTKSIKKIAIVGGGTAGWMTAASLCKFLKNSDVQIVLVDSSDIGTIGVGEATIPTIRRFYSDLGMSDIDVIRATNATCKLGIEFVDWHRKGCSFIHPFGLYGQDVKGVGFHHFWMKLQQLGRVHPFESFSLAVALAKDNKFALPVANPTSPLSIYDWALHFDATAFSRLMKKYACSNGVEHIDAEINEVTLRKSDGAIESLKLKTGTVIGADFFVDCSGFKAILLGGALGVEYEDWRHWLPCDRAIAAQGESVAEFPPYTQSIAHEAGWSWRIPLQNRLGSGVVYSSEYVSDERALNILNGIVLSGFKSEPKSIKFRPGMRKVSWEKNCVAIGLSSGFIEPLESTSIALIENAIARLKMLFTPNGISERCVQEFNEMSRLEYEGCRDFIILHYKLNQRRGEPFWDACRRMDVPERLLHKMEVFRARGHLVKYRWEIFQAPSWQAIYFGNGFHPSTYDPLVDHYDPQYLKNALNEMYASISKYVGSTPSHAEFLKRYLA